MNDLTILEHSSPIKDFEGLNSDQPLIFGLGRIKEEDGHYICMLNNKIPHAPGFYVAYTEKQKTPVIIHLEFIINYSLSILEGRCCYLDDLSSIRSVINQDSWS